MYREHISIFMQDSVLLDEIFISFKYFRSLTFSLIMLPISVDLT